MKTLENNISYKIYSNGEEFIKENHAYLNATLQTSIEASFFLLNAQNYHELNRNNYALQFKKEDEILLILKLEPFNMLLFGSKNLCDFAANRIADLNLAVENVLGEEECTTYFLKCYQNRFKGDIVLQHSMQIMILSKQIYTPSALVFQCGSKDLKELAVCYCSFKKEALSEELEFSVALELLKGKEHTYYAIKDQGKIVSIAAKARNSDSICAISNVFTMPEYRKKGYAKQVVSKLAKDILDEGKKPYLYVDSTNPISNHLYLNLGFTYLPRHQIQYHYQPKTIKKAIFAGGCFWCMAEPFYSMEGVKRVISGFVGGEEILPAYKEVKHGHTAHREAILIEYDASKIKYSSLLDIYFSSIDPFDDGGQYIDRGYNYTCGIYTSNSLEKEEIYRRVKELEEKYNQKVCVDLCEDTLFYPAEEEHQDYALKHPQEMEKELNISGRLKKGEKNNG